MAPTLTKSVNRIGTLSKKNKIAFTLSLLSFLFFFPGIFLSMLNVSTTGSINAKVPHVESGFLGIPSVKGTERKHMSLNIFNTTRSVTNTIGNLYQKDYFFVATMILLFSVLVPLIKEILIVYIFFCKSEKVRKSIMVFIKSIGKWSMCDVFIVSVLLAYLSTGSTQTQNVKNISMMGFNVNVDVLAGMHAHLEMGYWFFVTYCLLSLLALQLYDPY